MNRYVSLSIPIPIPGLSSNPIYIHIPRTPFETVTNQTRPFQSQSVFTCGEDGFVRAWKLAEEGAPVQAGSARARPKKEKKDRFKPY